MKMHRNVCSRVTAALVALFNTNTHADTFGIGANAFTIDFVTIGNPGNLDDAGAGGGIYSSPYGGVSYTYRMGTFEISQNAITTATASGLLNVTAGPWTGNQPATNMTWYEAAAFVNWLNTSSGHQAAYNLNGTATTLTLWSSAEAWQAGGENLYRHRDAYYFLPSEDEWYKTAYHKNDGVTANYWDFATGSNNMPTEVASGTGAGTAVYALVTSSPAAVNNNGGLSSYGTRGQNGNVFEWNESASDAPNDASSENRTLRGGAFVESGPGMRSSFRLSDDPAHSLNFIGFRVASVPEPSVAILLLGSGLLFAGSRGLRRRY
jgi:hypothetical protein